MKIGDIFYRYTSPSLILEYEITGIIKRKQTILYELSCLSCNHKPNCELIIAQNIKGELTFVSMENEDEDEPQQYWHEDGVYRKTKKEAILDAHNKVLDYYIKEKQELEEAIKRTNKKIEDIKGRIKEVNILTDPISTDDKEE